MITLAQEICCLDCRYSHYHFCKTNPEFDTITCGATEHRTDGAVAADTNKGRYGIKPFGVDATSTLPTHLAKMVEVICG